MEMYLCAVKSTKNLKQATSVLVGWWLLLLEGGTDD